MRIVSQMQCFVLFLWAVCKPKMMQSNIKSSWLSWNRWLSTRSVLLVFSSSLGKPLFGRPIGLSIGCSLHLELTSIYLLFVLVNVLMQANAEAVLCECICSGKSPWLHRQEHWRGAGGTQFLIFIVLMVKMLFCRWTLLCTREGPAWWSTWPASILRFCNWLLTSVTSKDFFMNLTLSKFGAQKFSQRLVAK